MYLLHFSGRPLSDKIILPGKGLLLKQLSQDNQTLGNK